MDSNVAVGIKSIEVYEPHLKVCIEDIKGTEGIKDETVAYMGIKEVRVANEREHPCHMAVSAAKKAMASACLEPEEINMLIYTNAFLSEYPLWSDYANIQEQLGMKHAFSCKINQACNSQMLALDYARAKLLTSQDQKHVLIVSSERWDSSYINRFTSAASCFYGDGASAAIISKGVAKGQIMGIDFLTDGSLAGLHYIPMGGTLFAPNYQGIDQKQYRFEPRETCKQYLESKEAKAVLWDKIISNNVSMLQRLLLKNNIEMQDIRSIVTYNMAKGIIEELCGRLGKKLSDSSFFVAERYGHIGSSDICFNLKKMIENERVQSGDLVALISAGFGFSWSVGLIRI